MTPPEVGTPEEPAKPRCPHCLKESPSLSMAINGPMAYFWCAHCMNILNCQLLAIPQQAQRMIQVPGGMIS